MLTKLRDSVMTRRKEITDTVEAGLAPARVSLKLFPVGGDRMRNIKLTLEYEGTNYQGWQVQARGITVQGVIEEKLALITGEKVHLISSGRTDAGVHAIAQVV